MGMSVAEFEKQKTTGRFRVLGVDDARKLGLSCADCCYDEDYRYLLVEFIDEKPARIVGSDGGAPEDQSLLRDWRWVAFEMNQLAAAAASGDSARRAAEARSHSHLRLAIRKLLENASCDEWRDAWTIQGFGMLRMYLSKEVRLHVWDPGYSVANVSTIHDHPWDFVSTVLCGSIRDIVYEEEQGAATHHEQRILCGAGGHAVGATQDARLRVVSDKTFRAGESYKLYASQLHESRPEPGTVTLIDRTFGKDPDHARVFFPLGTEWVSAEPRQASRLEVGLFSRKARQCLDAELGAALPAAPSAQPRKPHIADCACGACMGWAKEPHRPDCNCNICFAGESPKPADEPEAVRAVAEATACYCSEYVSSGWPCLPGCCPNVPTPEPAEEQP